MSIKIFINKILRTILNPAQNWGTYNFVDKNFKSNFRIVFIFTLSIVFLSRFIGTILSYLPSSSFQYILLYSVLSLAVDVIYFWIVVLAVKKVASFYNVNVSKKNASVLIFSTLMPFYLSSVILNLFSSIYFLSIVALYGFYILYQGIEKFICIPQKDVIVFFIISSLIIVGFYLILQFVIIYPFFRFII